MLLYCIYRLRILNNIIAIIAVLMSSELTSVLNQLFVCLRNGQWGTSIPLHITSKFWTAFPIIQDRQMERWEETREWGKMLYETDTIIPIEMNLREIKVRLARCGQWQMKKIIIWKNKNIKEGEVRSMCVYNNIICIQDWKERQIRVEKAKENKIKRNEERKKRKGKF